MGSQRIRHNVETEQQQLAGFIKRDDVGLCVCMYISMLVGKLETACWKERIKMLSRKKN